MVPVSPCKYGTLKMNKIYYKITNLLVKVIFGELLQHYAIVETSVSRMFLLEDIPWLIVTLSVIYQL